MFGEIVGGAHAAGDAAEVLPVVGERLACTRGVGSGDGHVESIRWIRLSIEGIVMKGAGVEADTPGRAQPVKCLFSKEERADIELVVGRDDEFRSVGSVIFLVHAVQTYREIPVVDLGKVIFDIIGVRVFPKIKTRYGVEDRMAEFLADATLYAQIHLQPAIIAHFKTVTGKNAVMLHMLVQPFDRIAVEIMLGDDLPD